MATTYIVTGQDTGQPRIDYTGTLTGLKPGDTFTTTLSGPLEAKLLGAGLIAKAPLPAMVTSAGTPDGSGKVLTSTAAGLNEGAWLPASGGGGSSAGAHITHKFAFAYNLANLHTGAVAAFTDGYTPAIGDLLIDAWVEIDTAWNGTTPTCDFGGFPGGTINGWLSDFAGAGILMTTPDTTGSIYDAQLLNNAQIASSLLSSWLHNSGDTFRERPLPSKFVTTDPIKVVVSQDGFITGADPGATQGTAVLYVTTATF